MKAEDYLIPGLIFKSPFSKNEFEVVEASLSKLSSDNTIYINNVKYRATSIVDAYIYYRGEWAEIVYSPLQDASIDTNYLITN